MRNVKRRGGAFLVIAFLLVVGSFVATDQLGGDSERQIPGASGTSDPAPPESAAAQEPTEEIDAANALENGLNMNEEQARTTLEVLPVEKPASMAGYSRDDFPHWRSAQEWGWEDDLPDASDCDAREATLARDGVDVESNPETCRADEGEWTDPYTGDEIAESSDADVDHIVPLAAAYRAGADSWNEEQRTIYANSPLVLVTSGAAANQEKGDKGPEAWKPDNQEAWCTYSLRWIAVKNEFGLNLTSEEERAALEEMLNTCSEGAV